MSAKYSGMSGRLPCARGLGAWPAPRDHRSRATAGGEPFGPIVCARAIAWWTGGKEATMHLPPSRVGALAIAIAAVGAVACSPTSRPATTPTTGHPATVTTSAGMVPSTATPLPATIDVRVYLLRGDKIDVGHREVLATPKVATAALRQLLAGPTPEEAAAGLASAVPTG